MRSDVPPDVAAALSSRRRVVSAPEANDFGANWSSTSVLTSCIVARLSRACERKGARKKGERRKERRKEKGERRKEKGERRKKKGERRKEKGRREKGQRRKGEGIVAKGISKHSTSCSACISVDKDASRSPQMKDELGKHASSLWGFVHHDTNYDSAKPKERTSRAGRAARARETHAWRRPVRRKTEKPWPTSGRMGAGLRG